MKTRVPFTPKEDMDIWKMFIADQGNTTAERLGDSFEERTQRRASSVLCRWRYYLLPHLPKTQFHSQTKLELCRIHRIKMKSAFVKQLEKDAEIHLNERDIVTSYNLRPGCRKNEDMQLSDEDFMKITAPLVSKRMQFSPEEDAEIWKYVLERHETFDRSQGFFADLSRRLKRSNKRLLRRFIKHIYPKIHLKKIPIEDALKLYNCSQVPVDKEYLKELGKHAYLEIDKNGWLIGYKLKDGRAEKRKSTEESEGSAKKARGSGSETADENQEEEEESDDDESENKIPIDSGESNGNDREDLVVDGIVPKSIVPKEEPIDDLEESPVVTSREDIAPLIRQPKIEVIEPVSEQVIIGENEQEVTAEEEVSQSVLVGMVEEVMQRVDEKMTNQDATFEVKLAIMRVEIEASAEEKMNNQLAKMKAELEASAEKNMKNLKASFEEKMMELMAKGSGSNQNDLQVTKTDTNRETSETTSNRKKCLLHLKKLISSFDSPETAAIEQKIESVFNGLPDVDEKPFPPDMLGAVIATADRFIDRLL